MEQSQLQLYAQIGAVRLGQFACRCGDMPNCGPGTIAAGSNTMATAEGASAYGHAERPGDIRADAIGATASGHATGEGQITASGIGARAGGVASTGGTITASEKGSTALGTASNRGEVRASGPGASAHGNADTNGQLLAKGTAAEARGWASESGVLQATQMASKAHGIAIEGLIEATSPFAEAYGVVTSSNQRTVSKGAFSRAVGLNIRVEGAYGYAAGQHGVLDCLLPSFALFAGVDAASSPSMLLTTTAVGPQPLGLGAATAWHSAASGFKQIFEWRDGNPLGEDRCGLFVTLKEGKLVRANGADAIGVTSDSYGFLAGTGLSLRCDDLGRPLLQPDYSYSLNAELLRLGCRPYAGERIPTEEQARALGASLGLPSNATLTVSYVVEADPAGTSAANERGAQPVTLLGRAIVHDMGECTRNTCGCEYGIAVPGDRWRIVRRVSPTTIEILLI